MLIMSASSNRLGNYVVISDDESENIQVSQSRNKQHGRHVEVAWKRDDVGSCKSQEVYAS